MLKNYITLIIIGRKDRSIKIHNFVLWLSLSLILMVLGYTGVIYYKYYDGQLLSSSYRELRKNYLEQVLNYKEIQDKLEKYSKQLENIADFDKKIRVITNQNKFKTKKDFEVTETNNTNFLQDNGIEDSIGFQERNIISHIKNIELNYQIRQANLSELENLIRDNSEQLLRTPSVKPLREGRFVSGFGLRNDPFTGALKFHEGVDWAAPLYTPVIAAANGVVVYTYQENTYGKLIAINHGYGIVTRYAHLAQIEVRPGQRVRKGSTIGRVGNTGRGTGSHLHYEVIIRGGHVDPLNYVIER